MLVAVGSAAVSSPPFMTMMAPTMTRISGSSHVRVWEVSEWAGVQVVAWAACPSCHQ